jgi:hypothetical protein
MDECRNAATFQHALVTSAFLDAAAFRGARHPLVWNGAACSGDGKVAVSDCRDGCGIQRTQKKFHANGHKSFQGIFP